jgi:hypothetical protein
VSGGHRGPTAVGMSIRAAEKTASEMGLVRRRLRVVPSFGSGFKYGSLQIISVILELPIKIGLTDIL